MGGTQLKFLFPTYHDPTKYWQVGLLHGELENQISTQWLCHLSGVLWFPPPDPLHRAGRRGSGHGGSHQGC